MFYVWKIAHVCKTFMMNFIYEVIETFCFPDENVRESIGLSGWKFFIC